MPASPSVLLAFIFSLKASHGNCNITNS